MLQVSANVYAETRFQGCNVGLVVTSEGVALVDTPQAPTEAIRWREEVEKHGPLRYLINTEHHGDHILGNFFFPTTVVSHQGTRDAFLSSLGSPEQVRERVRNMDPRGLPLIADYQPRPPTITFSEEMTLYVGEQVLRLIHLPGHTAYEIAVYLPQERVLFTGDNVVHKLPPFMHQAEPLDWLESLKRMQALDVEAIVPGHGPPCGKEHIARYAQDLEGCIEKVRQALAQGWSLAEAQARISFLDPYPIPPEQRAFYLPFMQQGIARLYEKLGG